MVGQWKGEAQLLLADLVLGPLGRQFLVGRPSLTKPSSLKGPGEGWLWGIPGMDF